MQITSDTKAGPDFDELDSWSSLLSAARHYEWVIAIRLNGVTMPDQIDHDLPGDLLLLPHLEAESFGRPSPRRRATTYCVDRGERGGRVVEAAAGRRFRFGEIPRDAAPETVLARITALH